MISKKDDKNEYHQTKNVKIYVYITLKKQYNTIQ